MSYVQNEATVNPNKYLIAINRFIVVVIVVVVDDDDAYILASTSSSSLLQAHRALV